MEYVYHMRDPKGALLFLQDLHREVMDIWRSGIAFLLEDEISVWYIFVNVDPAAGNQIEALLADKGQRSEYTVDELSTHPNKAFMSSGTFEQIMNDLDAFGDAQRELRKERIRAAADSN